MDTIVGKHGESQVEECAFPALQDVLVDELRLKILQ